MATQAKPISDPNDATNQPVYWFAMLEQARDENDFSAAAEAQAELRRLGVNVNYSRRQITEAVR